MESSMTIGEDVIIFLPDYDYDYVRCFINCIYGCLDDIWSGSALELAGLQTIFEALIIDLQPWGALDPLVISVNKQEQDACNNIFSNENFDIPVKQDDCKNANGFILQHASTKEEIPTEMEENSPEPFYSDEDADLSDGSSYAPAKQAIKRRKFSATTVALPFVKKSTVSKNLSEIQIRPIKNEEEKIETNLQELEAQMSSSKGSLVVAVQNNVFFIKKLQVFKGQKSSFCGCSRDKTGGRRKWWSSSQASVMEPIWSIRFYSTA